MELCFLESLYAISIELTPNLIIHDTAQLIRRKRNPFQSKR